MKTNRGILFKKMLAVMTVAAIMAAVGLLGLLPALADEHSAIRSFDPQTVEPGGEVVVKIEATGYGSLGAVTETLPAGFSYVSSSLTDEGEVTVDGQTIKFILQGADKTFTYTVTVTASSTAGSYNFSGVLRDDDRNDRDVVGQSSVTVGAPAPTAGSVQSFTVDNTVNRPGAVSGYRITFVTAEDLVANEDVITVHFDKDFKGHGTSLSKSHVTVSSSNSGGAITPNTSPSTTQTGAFNPGSDASLDRLTSAKHHLPDKDALNNIEYQILVPDMNGTSDGAPAIAANSAVTVVISPAAGIMNATEGGNKGPIGVFTSKQTTLAYNTVTVRRDIALSSYASNRNKSLTIRGSGFQNGTDATVYLVTSDGDRHTLVSVLVEADDTFEASITVTVPPFEAGKENMISVEDGNQPPFKAGPVKFEV